MAIIKVTTQQELDAACEQQKGDATLIVRVFSPAEIILVLRGSSHAELWGSSHAELWGSSHAELWESSHAELRGSSHAELWGSSHAVLWESSHAVLWESSHAELRGSSHAELWESSHAELRGSSHAELWESSHAELWESSHAVLWGSSHAVARDYCVIKSSPQASITIHGETPSVTGGVQIKYVPPLTAGEWCGEHGVEVKDGIAILFKGVNDDFTSNGHTQSSRNLTAVCYKPGTKPQAEDWDGGEQECGRGLHFSPTPRHTQQFAPNAKRWVGCPVRVADIIVHKNPTYPSKVKAPGVCAPCFEVDIDGKKIEQKAQKTNQRLNHRAVVKE